MDTNHMGEEEHAMFNREFVVAGKWGEDYYKGLERNSYSLPDEDSLPYLDYTTLTGVRVENWVTGLPLM